MMIEVTRTNVSRIRNCRAYSEPMTSDALGGLAGSRQTLLHMANGGRTSTAAILKVWRHIKHPSPWVDVHRDPIWNDKTV